MLWYTENRLEKEIAAIAGASRPTVNPSLSRYTVERVVGLLGRKRGAGREQAPVRIRARILAATRTAPPQGPDVRVVAGPGRNVLPDHHPPGHPGELRCHAWILVQARIHVSQFAGVAVVARHT